MKKLQALASAILFILIFSIGNVVNLIWKKDFNKVFWIGIGILWTYNLYNWYQDPSGYNYVDIMIILMLIIMVLF